MIESRHHMSNHIQKDSKTPDSKDKSKYLAMSKNVGEGFTEKKIYYDSKVIML